MVDQLVDGLPAVHCLQTSIIEAPENWSPTGKCLGIEMTAGAIRSKVRSNAVIYLPSGPVPMIYPIPQASSSSSESALDHPLSSAFTVYLPPPPPSFSTLPSRSSISSSASAPLTIPIATCLCVTCKEDSADVPAAVTCVECLKPGPGPGGLGLYLCQHHSDSIHSVKSVFRKHQQNGSVRPLHNHAPLPAPPTHLSRAPASTSSASSETECQHPELVDIPHTGILLLLFRCVDVSFSCKRCARCGLEFHADFGHPDVLVLNFNHTLLVHYSVFRRLEQLCVGNVSSGTVSIHGYFDQLMGRSVLSSRSSTIQA
jgi:hypothetical protein